MRRLVLGLGLVALVAAPAAAQPKKPRPPTVQETVLAAFEDGLQHGRNPPRFAFRVGDVAALDPKQEDLELEFEVGFAVHKSTVGLSGDGRSAWVSAHLAWFEPCGDESCPRVPKPDGFYQASMLLEDRGGWKPVAWIVDTPVDARTQARMLKEGAAPNAISGLTRKGAEEAVALFQASIGDPKALAKTVTTRADAALFGSDLKERYIGGKKVAATLTRWNLAFKVRDGIQAGVAGSGNVAWVAANVDATSVKKPGSKPTPYRVFCIYEKGDAGWKLVVMHFSFVG